MSSSGESNNSTTGESNNSTTGEGYSAQFTMMDKVKEYLEALNVVVGDRLSDHAAAVHHEDLPHDVAESTGTSTSTSTADTETGTVTPSSARSVVPDRLNMRIPPLNYGAVVPGSIYRCSYPQPENYEFIKDLKIKSILTLVPEQIPDEYQSFMDSAGIQHFRVHIRANKGEVRVESCEMQRALRLIMDRTNHPIMIHCNKGKHRTGCTIACFRRICGLDMDTIREEYHTYAGKKARFLDEVFFETFDLNLVMWIARQERWAGSKVDCGSGFECTHKHEEEVGIDAINVTTPPSPPLTPIICPVAAKHMTAA
jgi:tyrosine-protein phosphatase SIW14